MFSRLAVQLCSCILGPSGQTSSSLFLASAGVRVVLPNPRHGGSFRVWRAMSATTAPLPSSAPELRTSSDSDFEVEKNGSLKRKSRRVVGTHNGTFHCDEALACFMIRLTDKYADAEIIRTRDEKILQNLDAVLDVGGVYSAEGDRFDHHQRGFDQVFGHGFITKLSSAGLVYKHYGLEIVAKELNLDTSHPDVERVYLAVYKNFIEAVDAIDNGVNQYDTDQPPRYVNNTHLSARVARLNPDWIDEVTSEKEDSAFFNAMQLTGTEFQEALHYYALSWLPARSIVAECIAARTRYAETGEIMVLDRFCPWKSHLAELEEEMKLEPSIKYVLYEDDRNHQWRVQAVAVAPGKFESRKPLPQQWRGLRDEELSAETGIGGGVFVHMSGFIGGNKSFDGTLAMAKKALVIS